MNYGKSQLEERLNQLEDTTPQFVHALGVWILRLLFLSTLFLVIVGGAFAYGSFKGIVDAAPSMEKVSKHIMPLGYASFVYDADGNQIQKLTGSGSNRIAISIDEIPINMQHAVVAIEDSRFYEHNGVDPSGIVRAFATGILNGFHFTEGASTITQQLLKNNVFTDWMSESRLDSIRRKIQEQYLAVQLEAYLNENGQYSKSVILENYLNTINMGAGAYGVQTAAMTYFGKQAKDLTLSECAVLASIPQSPTRMNPKTHPENNAKRRAKVLDNMLAQNFITQAEYDEAMLDPVYDRIAQVSAMELEDETGDIYSYFVDEVIGDLIEELQVVKGYTLQEAKNAVYSGGLSIYTTQDSAIQQIMDEEFLNEENYPAGTRVSLDWALTIQHADDELENYSKEMLRGYFRNQDDNFDLLFENTDYADFYIELYKAAIMTDGDKIIAERKNFTMQPQAAMIIMDQETGYVKGIVGGRGTKTASLTLNRATDEFNQPGSTFKIVSTYGPAIDIGKVDLNTVINDSEYFYSDGTPLHNSDNQYHGNVSVLDSIVQSYNIPAVKTLTDITPQVGYDYLLSLGFHHLSEYDIIQPLALGGITNGVTVEELTAAYSTIANGGIYLKPTFYTKVVDATGNVLIDHTRPSGTRVFKTSTCYLLTEAMQQVVLRGTGTPCQIPNMHVAGKTGTTNDVRDLLFVGYTPYYTAGIWGGYDTNAECEDTSFQKLMWQKVMSRVHAILPDQQFDTPSSITAAEVCKATGLLPGYNCETEVKYFTVSQAPVSHCPGHYVPDSQPAAAEQPTYTEQPADNSQTGYDMTIGETPEAEPDPEPEPQE